jgi:hypothetical protein
LKVDFLILLGGGSRSLASPQSLPEKKKRKERKKEEKRKREGEWDMCPYVSG